MGRLTESALAAGDILVGQHGPGVIAEGMLVAVDLALQLRFDLWCEVGGRRLLAELLDQLEHIGFVLLVAPQPQVLLSAAYLQQLEVEAVHLEVLGLSLQLVDGVPELALQPGVVIQAFGAPGLDYRMEMVVVVFGQGRDLAAGLLACFIDRSQPGGFRQHPVHLRLHFFDIFGLPVDQEILLGSARCQHAAADIERVALFGLEHLPESPVVGQRLFQGAVVLPDDAEKQQTNQPETESDRFPDAQLIEQITHRHFSVSLLAFLSVSRAAR